jgi:hypothetical protein
LTGALVRQIEERFERKKTDKYNFESKCSNFSSIDALKVVYKYLTRYFPITIEYSLALKSGCL